MGIQNEKLRIDFEKSQLPKKQQWGQRK
jgi:hypothetical protein